MGIEECVDALASMLADGSTYVFDSVLGLMVLGLTPIRQASKKR